MRHGCRLPASAPTVARDTPTCGYYAEPESVMCRLTGPPNPGDARRWWQKCAPSQVDAQVDSLALLRRVAPVTTRNDLLQPSADRGASVDVGVGTEFLDDVDLHRQAFGGDLEVLGANTQNNLGFDDTVHRLARNRNDPVTECDAAVDDGEGEEVHRG